MLRLLVGGLSLAAIGSAEATSGTRNLIQSIQSYKPKTVVTDYAALDLDLRLIQSQLATERDSGFRIAQRVYQEGAYSRPAAELILSEPLEVDIPAGTEVIGPVYDESSFTLVKGVVHDDTKAGEIVLDVLYNIRDDQDDYVDCLAGANPDPFLGGCFAEKGTVQLPELQLMLDYSYSVLTGNVNYRSFQKESLYARDRLYDCRNCPKPDYNKFVDYYGIYDYADHIIVRAFQADETDMQKGNQDFRAFGWAGRRAIIENSIVWLTMFMEVISRMERSLDECFDTDITSDDALIFWDSAVAFYTGSQVFNESGVFLYHVANTRCLSASTCGENGVDDDGIAWVNYQVFHHFETGQKHLLERNCKATQKNKEKIVRLMLIPMIQGAIRRTRFLEDQEYDYERHLGEGIAYSSAVLPFIHACNPDDASTIHNILKATNDEAVNFSEVRDAFARNLPCLQITCEEIGSVLELSFNGETCSTIRSQVKTTDFEDESTSNKGTIILYTFLAITGTVICCLILKIRTNQSTKEKDSVFDGQKAPSSEDVDTIIKAEDYAPQYWSDCKTEGEKAEEGSKVTGEML